MFTKDYTRTFADVYLKELDYIAERREQMKLTYGSVEKESQRLRDKLPEKQESAKEISDEFQTGVLGILEKFSAWLLVGLFGLLTITTLWSFFYSETSIKWGLLIFTAWVLWFFLLKFRLLFLGIAETTKPSRLNIKPSTDAALIGLALSGGGVRSATFNLGLLQSLAKYKVLQYCDYLSTVSGGGYIGSCLTSLLTKNQTDAKTSTKADEFPLRNEPDDELEECAEVNYLRKTKDYLGVGGFFNRDTWHMIGTMFSGVTLTITMPLAILLLMVLGLYEYNNLEASLQEKIQKITLFFIILLSVWIIIIRLRQVSPPSLRWLAILLEGPLMGAVVLIFTLIPLSFMDNQLLIVLPFAMIFLLWWVEIVRLGKTERTIPPFSPLFKKIISIVLEALLLIFALAVLSGTLQYVTQWELKSVFFTIISVLLFLLIVRIRCQSCFRQIENILELERRISLRAFVVGFLLALVLLLSFIQYLTEMFFETMLIPETTVYVTSPYLLGAFILTLVVGYLLANKANKLVQNSIKMATAIISILLIFSFCALLLAEILLKDKSVEAGEVINTIQIGIVDPDNSHKKIEKLPKGWEKLKFLLVWKGEERVREITTRICGEKCVSGSNLNQEQNDSPNTRFLLSKYPSFFTVGKLPSWNPQNKCDSKEVNLLIQLKKKVDAEKHWQMQKAKTLTLLFEEASILDLLLNSFPSKRDLEQEYSSLLLQDELDKWLEAIYTIAFYQCAHLDLEQDVLDKLKKEFGDIKQSNWVLSKEVMVFVLVLVLLSLLTNINRNSLHDFYRIRLSGTYLIKRGKDDKMEPNGTLRLTDIHEHRNGPYHLVNTTLNVPTSESAQLQGRGADFFVFSKYYCGSESTGYRSTETYNNGQFELAAAMAISGAAASPGMGESTNPIMAFWMTMLNVRLNLWVLNPNLKQKPKMIIWPFYLAKEFFRQGRTDDILLNLSDGGHHENLGIYPLLKRRCKVIIASDAGADPKFEMTDLANLQRKARIDLGINIEFDLSDLRPDLENKGYAKAYFVEGTITYPEDENGNKQTGTLFYIKTTMVGKEPEDLLAYRRTHPTFPDETTADQFFDEDQFESYRKLGELAGYSLEEKVSLAEYIKKTCSCNSQK